MRVALPFGSVTPEVKRAFYRNALRKVGIEPVEGADTLEEVAGLLLAGGEDVNPALYGEPRHPRTEPSDDERDRLEVALLEEALDRDLPVLAICRGLQLFNVVLGGSLEQHVEGHSQRKVRDAHTVRIAPGTVLSSILGVAEYSVNSRHHQAVSSSKVARGVTVAATTPDGLVEALEVPGKRFALAVQWHPESRTDGPDIKLFEAFRRAVEDASAGRSHSGTRAWSGLEPAAG